MDANDDIVLLNVCNSQITVNTVAGIQGIYVSGSSNNTIDSNYVADYSTGLFLYDSWSNNITKNLLRERDPRA